MGHVPVPIWELGNAMHVQKGPIAWQKLAMRWRLRASLIYALGRVGGSGGDAASSMSTQQLAMRWRCYDHDLQ